MSGGKVQLPARLRLACRSCNDMRTHELRDLSYHCLSCDLETTGLSVVLQFAVDEFSKPMRLSVPRQVRG